MGSNKLEKQAIGIVAQLFDLAEVSVDKRQEINDKSYDYMIEQLRLHIRAYTKCKINNRFKKCTYRRSAYLQHHFYITV